jgi:hypothetical protein
MAADDVSAMPLFQRNLDRTMCDFSAVADAAEIVDGHG